MSKRVKELITRELTDRFAGSEGCVFVSFHGLSAGETMDVRGALREKGIRMTVVKNRLYLKAMEATLGPEVCRAEETRRLVKGPSAVVQGEDGALGASRALLGLLRKHPALRIKGGLMGRRVISLEEVQLLARLPDREVALAYVAAAVSSPLSSVLGAVQALLCSVVWAVESLRAKRAEAESSEGEQPADQAGTDTENT